MGREVRRVPADWQHPKHWTGGLRGPAERYKPLFPGERYQAAVDEWDEECAKWKAGWRPEHCTDPDGIPCFPMYGIGPHYHPQVGVCTTIMLPQSAPGFSPDPNEPGMGTWWCPYCEDGKPALND